MQADHTANSPPAILVLPDQDKLIGLGGCFTFLVIDKSMQADLYRTIISDGVHLYATTYEYAGHFAANVFPDRVQQSLFIRLQATPVMVKFNTVRVYGSLCSHITVVIRGEIDTIHMDDLII